MTKAEVERLRGHAADTAAEASGRLAGERVYLGAYKGARREQYEQQMGAAAEQFQGIQESAAQIKDVRIRGGFQSAAENQADLELFRQGRDKGILSLTPSQRGRWRGIAGEFGDTQAQLEAQKDPSVRALIDETKAPKADPAGKLKEMIEKDNAAELAKYRQVLIDANKAWGEVFRQIIKDEAENAAKQAKIDAAKDRGANPK